MLSLLSVAGLLSAAGLPRGMFSVIPLPDELFEKVRRAGFPSWLSLFLLATDRLVPELCGRPGAVF